MPEPTTIERLSPRQLALLERVCLKRYTVIFEHYMGSHRPNEGVYVDDEQGDRDYTFRPVTVEALRSRGLVRFVQQGQGRSKVVPTRAGIERFRPS